MGAVIFDWDGTLVSCEEKIDATIQQVCFDFIEIRDVYHVAIADRMLSPGWVKKRLLASLPEDYFTYHFGIIAKLLVKSQGFMSDHETANDMAWSIILTTFKGLYRKTPSRLLVDRQLLMALAKQAEFYVVSNSDTENIRNEARILGIDDSLFTFIGNAEKYHIESSDPSILGIPTVRPRYRQILLSIREKHNNDIIAVGDNFSMDLVTPFSMGIRVAYISNPLRNSLESLSSN